jgi:histone H3/H4
MSDLPVRPTGDLERIINIAESQLQQIDHTPFSPKAFERLKEKVGEYAAQLVTESVRVARRRESDTVSTKNVEQASQYLVSSTGSKFYRNIGTLGGILLGAGLSTFLSMVAVGLFTTTAVLVALTLTVFGMFMVALQIAKD